MTLCSLSRLLPILSLMGAPAWAASGGPDGYGYLWADSYEPGVNFSYEYAANPESGFGDDDYLVVSLGFSFEFYGSNYTTITITSNGIAHFDGASALTYNNTSLPYGSYATIAPMWDDLNPASGGTIYWGTTGTSPNRVFVAEWWYVPHFSDIGEVSFELKLFEVDDAIEFHYLDMDFGDATYNWGASATCGIAEGAFGYDLQRSYNQAVLTNSYAIRIVPDPCDDADGDGYDDDTCGGNDCDDGNAAVHPGASEVCDGILDNDCSGNTDPDEVDNDGDGYTECDDDCADNDNSTYPGAPEVCDGVADNDCNGSYDPDEVDDDGDGETECEGDCDDGDDTVHSTAPEICDGNPDNDCDGSDDPNEVDNDADGFDECADDCDDHDASVYPGAPEVCDGVIDNDCDGQSDPDEGDDDGDGRTECDGDCDDTDPTIYGGADENCFDGIDNDCDGAVDASDTECGGTQGDDDTAADDDDMTDADDDKPTPPGRDDDSLGISCDCRIAGVPRASRGVLALLPLAWLTLRRLRR